MQRKPRSHTMRRASFVKSGLFKRYAITLSTLLLTSFFILGAAFIVTIAQFWSDEKLSQLSENVQRIEERAVQIFGNNPETSFELKESLLLYVLTETANTLNTGIDEFSTLPTQYVLTDVFIANLEGEVVYCSDMLTVDELGFSFVSNRCRTVHQSHVIPPELMERALQRPLSGLNDFGGMFSENRYFASDPMETGANGEINGVVFASAPLTQGLRSYIQDVTVRFIGAVLVSLLLLVGVIAFLSYRLTKPLLDMQHAASRYSVGDFSIRVYYRNKKKPKKKRPGEKEKESKSSKKKRKNRRHPDELYALVESFNAMAQDLSVLEQTRRSFVANVSHELKTPMTSIGGFIEGILDGTIPPPKHTHYLGIVSGEIKRLSRLVTGMLNMSRIEAGELNMRPKPFDLSELLLTTLLNFERLIEQKDVTVEGIEQLTSESVWVSADRDMLSQVVYNLCDNAVKFVNGGGTLGVRAWEEDDKVYVTIRNSGDGIEKKDLSNIFERFYKVDQSRSYDTKSAGLGLYIVKTIVDLHGGKIYAESTENQFAEFTFWLPK